MAQQETLSHPIFGEDIEVKNSTVYAVDFQLLPNKNTTISTWTGHLVHASVLTLVGQIDPSLSARLHNQPGYRPYTVSPLIGGAIVGEGAALRRGAPCHLRITLLDGGVLWDALQTH